MSGRTAYYCRTLRKQTQSRPLDPPWVCLHRSFLIMSGALRRIAGLNGGSRMKDKTNAMRILDSIKISYGEYEYDSAGAISGVEVAKVIGQPPERVFKTLVTTGKTGAHYVFMIPVAEELDLKKAAAHVGEKSIEMLKSKELLALTGYIHGGCSPIGMKKFFTTTIHQTAEELEMIVFSGGKLGCQIELGLDALGRVIRYTLGDIVKNA